jgi:hypothetical protein
MIPIFPVCLLSLLALVEFLPRPSSDQLNRIRDDISFTAVFDEKVVGVTI